MRRYWLVTLCLVGCLLPASASETKDLKSFVRGSWQQLVHAHAGRPTLVHFWGVTCGPCKVELPLLGQFMKGHPDIDVVMISADLVPNLPEATQSMLTKAGLQGAESWMFDDGYEERLRFEIDPTWQGDIPRSILVARDGSATTMEGIADMQELETWSKLQQKP